MDAQPREISTAPLVTALIPIQRRILVPGENGEFVLTVQSVLTQQSIQSTYLAVAAQPFVCDDPLDPDFSRYDGLTCAEVMIRKQIEDAARTGDDGKIEKVMDRLIGRPMARSENLNISASYEDELRKIAGKTKAPIIDTQEVSVFGDMV